MNDTSVDQFVVLRGAAWFPTAAYLLVLDFENRGIEIRRHGDALLVRPEGRLTDADGASVRAFRPALLRLADYIAGEVGGHLMQPRAPFTMRWP